MHSWTCTTPRRARMRTPAAIAERRRRPCCSSCTAAGSTRATAASRRARSGSCTRASRRSSRGAGVVVVVPDYRLVPHVVFPGGAEDVRDAVRWVVAHPMCLRLDAAVEPAGVVGAPDGDSEEEPALDRILLIGHSAGAAHVATMLFHHGVLPADDPLRARIRAAVLQSPPYDLGPMTAAWATASVHAAYWTSLEAAHAADPLHLYRGLSEADARALPALLMVEGEREPEWLIEAGDAFAREVIGKVGVLPPRVVGKGHNHVSLNWALSTGEGEEWAEEVMEWLKKQLA